MDSTIPADLLSLKEQFDSWRQAKPHPRSPIPHHLLQSATSFLDRYSLSLICRLCRLHPSRLKPFTATPPPIVSHKVSRSKVSSKSAPSPLITQPPAASAAAPEHAFLQLHPTDLIDASSSISSHTLPSCRLVVERPCGTRLTLLLPACDPSAINALVSNFMRS